MSNLKNFVFNILANAKYPVWHPPPPGGVRGGHLLSPPGGARGGAHPSPFVTNFPLFLPFRQQNAIFMAKVQATTQKGVNKMHVFIFLFRFIHV